MDRTYLYPGNRIELHNGLLNSNTEMRIGSLPGTGASNLKAVVEGSGQLGYCRDLFVQRDGEIRPSGGSLTIDACDVFVHEGMIDISSGEVVELNVCELNIGDREFGGTVKLSNGELKFSLTTEEWDEYPSLVRINGFGIQSQQAGLLDLQTGIGSRVVLGGGTASTNFNTTSILEIHDLKDGFTAGRLELNGGTVNTDEVRLYDDGPVNSLDNCEFEHADSRLIGNGHIQGDLTSSSIVRTYFCEDEMMQDALLENRFLRPDSNQAVLTQRTLLDISGDLKLMSEGILDVQLSAETKNNPLVNTNLYVAGTATIDGSINLSIDEGFQPEIGDSFTLLVSENPIVGRFHTVTGTDLGEDSCLFLCVRYRKVVLGPYLVEAIVLRKPVLANNPHTSLIANGQTKLSIVTHGYNDTVFDDNGPIAGNSLAQIGSALQNLSTISGSGYQVLLMDWSQFNKFINTPPSAARNSRDIGEGLGHLFVETGLINSLQEVHFLGHSAGSYMIDSLAKFIVERRNIEVGIHLTFFDAYLNFSSLWPNDLPTEESLGNLGGFEQFYVEQYFDNGLWLTNSLLSCGYNIQVDSQDQFPGGLFGHSRPNWFYLATQSGELGNEIGMMISGENNLAGVQVPSFFEGQKGRRIVMNADNSFSTNIDAQPRWTPTFSDSSGGGMWLNTTGFITAPPALEPIEEHSIELLADIDGSPDYLSFDLKFAGPGNGSLSVFFNDLLITELDQNFVGGVMDDFESTNPISLHGPFAPGHQSLKFVFQSLGSQDATLEFTNVELGTFSMPMLGDVNCDGAINFLDISPFIAALTSSEYSSKADANQDGVVNFLDIAPFIAILTSS